MKSYDLGPFPLMFIFVTIFFICIGTIVHLNSKEPRPYGWSIVKFNNHEWVVKESRGDAIAHSPDCPCYKKGIEK